MTRPHLPYRSLAVTAAAAVALGGTASIAAAATSATTPQPVAITETDARILGLENILGPILDLLPGGLGDLLDELVNGTINGLLSGAQLESLLGGLNVLNPNQMQASLGLLSGGQLQQLLQGLSGSSALPMLNPSQLLALLQASPLQDFVRLLTELIPTQALGLLNTLTTGPLGDLLNQVAAGPFAQILQKVVGGGATPEAHTVAGLLQRLTQLLPADVLESLELDQFLDLLSPVTDLLRHAGISSLPFVSQLLTQLESLTASLPPAAGKPVSDLINNLRVTEQVLAYQAAAGNAPAGTPLPGGNPGAVQVPVSVKPVAKAPAKKYRATVRSVKLSASKRRLQVVVACPASVATSCKVKLSGQLRGKTVLRTRTVTVKPGKTRTVKVTVARSTAKQTKRLGGKVRVRATTVGGGKATHVKTLRVKRAAR